MKIAAFDLSLTGTGWAIWEGDSLRSGTLTTKKLTGMDRLNHILITVLKMADGCDQILMEGLSFGSNDPSAQERAGLAFLIRHRLWNGNRKYDVVAPTSLKKFVTGKGNAPKEMVIKEVFKRWGLEPADNNEADAIALLMIGRCLAGIMEPTTDPQREVLAVIRKSSACT